MEDVMNKIYNQEGPGIPLGFQRLVFAPARFATGCLGLDKGPKVVNRSSQGKLSSELQLSHTLEDLFGDNFPTSDSCYYVHMVLRHECG